MHLQLYKIELHIESCVQVGVFTDPNVAKLPPAKMVCVAAVMRCYCIIDS